MVSNETYRRQTYKQVANIGLALILIALMTFFCRSSPYALVVPVLLMVTGLYLDKGKDSSCKVFLHVGLLLGLITFTAHTIVAYVPHAVFYTPVAGIVMLTALLFNDARLTFMVSLLSGLLVALVSGLGFEALLIFFVGGLVGGHSVRDARTRAQLMGGGLFIGAIHLFCLFLIYRDVQVLLSPRFAAEKIYPLALNGFISVILVLGTLKIFEYLFGVLTNYSLLELSDFNQPLLKRMILEAPGTYHHSLVVSNLSEGAADAIGANALLARVGAYYHDIGKMVKPEYFTENQMMGGNKHDEIEPTMSRLVILNHVKEGVELAKKYKLNPLIADFIPQHHGTSLIHYFHQKALEAAQDGEGVDENDFRYPGPKPQFREVAIVLLADSVEGAVRAMDEPTPARIEEVVKKIINNKFIDGQLDECDLTLREIEIISATFTRILSAMYHSRVKYPEKKNGHSHRKPSEKNADSGQSPQKADSSDSGG